MIHEEAWLSTNRVSVNSDARRTIAFDLCQRRRGMEAVKTGEKSEMAVTV